MEFTLSWLKKFLETEASLEDIVEKLNNIGLEVDEIVDRSSVLKDFVIAEIVSFVKHPNADKLNICQVYDGKETLQIVCGANNVKSQMKVVLAPINSVIPLNELVIKKTVIRDSESNGMLCSFKELCLDGNSEGIIELGVDAIIGEKFSSYLGYEDAIIKIEVTPNRGDCLSVYGIARDLAAAGLGRLKKIARNENEFFGKQKNSEKSIIIDETLSQCFHTVIIKNLKNKQSPAWLQNYIRATGSKPISALVDIGNYLMYSFGQALHVYDLDKIKLPIEVRKSGGENFISLENQKYQLTDKDIVVCDRENIISLAGIIGGSESGVSSETTNIMIESAHFNDEMISYSGKFHNINSKAKYRFERKIDKKFVKQASVYFAEMVKEICGGEVDSVDSIESTMTDKSLIFRLSEIKNIGGLDISSEEFENIMSNLGFIFDKDSNENYHLTVASWRNDISIKEDIVEEILRIKNYSNLESTNFIQRQLEENLSVQVPSSNIDDKALKVLMMELGYDEVITWSFMAEKKASLFSDIHEDMKLKNPISDELNYMRPNILSNLLSVAEKNQNRNINNLSLFELGPIFNPSFERSEEKSLSIIKMGDFLDNNIYGGQREVDIYDLKQDLEEILNLYGHDLGSLQHNYELDGHYHKFRAINYLLNGKKIASFGEISPVILRKFSIKKRLVAAEIFLDHLVFSSEKSDKPIISNYPIVEREFGFVLPKTIESKEILEIVKNTDDLIRRSEVIDLYFDENFLGADNKALTIKIWLVSQEKTLDENILTEISEKIIKRAASIGAILRLNFK